MGKRDHELGEFIPYLLSTRVIKCIRLLGIKIKDHFYLSCAQPRETNKEKEG